MRTVNDKTRTCIHTGSRKLEALLTKTVRHKETMKRRIRKFSIALGLSGFAGLVQAATVAVEPETQNLMIGDLFTVSVVGQEFDIALDAGGLDITFDGSVIRPALQTDLSNREQVISYGAAWNTTPVAQIGDQAIENLFFFADSAPSESFEIATIWFKAIGNGQSAIDLTESQLNPFAGAGAALAVTLEDGSVNVVPLPAAFWLFGSALLGIFGVSNRNLGS